MDLEFREFEPHSTVVGSAAFPFSLEGGIVLSIRAVL